MKKRWVKPVVISLLCIITLLSSYLIIYLWWSSRYDIEEFNCVDMSYAIAPFFQKIGFNTSIIYGANDDTNEAHAWISINGMYFDATHLWFDDEKNYPRITYIDYYPYEED